jgi:hypothetical protein
VIEPNDGVDEPQELPGLRPGTRVEMCDAVDWPAIRSTPSGSWRANLCGSSTAGAPGRRRRAARAVVYDPVALRPVSSATDGRVSCSVQGVLDLVVRARTGRAEYALRIQSRPERAPRWGTGDVLQVSAGTELDLAPSAQERRISFTAREALELDAGARVIDRQSGLELSAGADGKVAVPALSAVELVLAPRRPRAGCR